MSFLPEEATATNRPAAVFEEQKGRNSCRDIFSGEQVFEQLRGSCSTCFNWWCTRVDGRRLTSKVENSIAHWAEAICRSGRGVLSTCHVSLWMSLCSLEVSSLQDMIAPPADAHPMHIIIPDHLTEALSIFDSHLQVKKNAASTLKCCCQANRSNRWSHFAGHITFLLHLLHISTLLWSQV